MGLLKTLVRTGKQVGSKLGSAIGDAVDQTGTAAKNSAEIAGLKMEISTIDQECEHIYKIVGRKYIESLISKMTTGVETEIDIKAEFKAILPKLKHKNEIQERINELEKADKQNFFMSEYNEAQMEYIKQKDKLDQALQMDIITEEEYHEKLSKFKSKVDNFEQIRKINMQYEMEIITKPERDAKLRALGVSVD